MRYGTAVLSLAMIAAASCCATTNAQRPRSAQAPQLAVGDDYFVHAVPLKPGCVVVHTVKSSGVMKPLLKIAPPEGALRASARGGVEVFPAGAARDGERLYVVAAERSPRATAATLKLHAFWLADGRPLVGEGIDLGTFTEATETLGAGALKLIEGGVECNGTALLFDGRRLQKIEANGRSFTPPPDLYETQEHGRIY